ncbi:MAG: hypothetical protein QMD36_05395 [Candidatus Aenigmarchaeota archaeon]|nr:hypothetical protein [Candidatus Aenigmarchaeota archaeon]
MEIEDAQSFVSDIVDFCSNNLIRGELIPMESIPELDIHPKDVDYIIKFVRENSVVKKPQYDNCINFSRHRFLNVSYNQPEGFKHKDQPFMPAWILTAMILPRVVRDLGATEVVDLFAGDGRIQYFASSIGLRSYGVEYSKELVNIQKLITERTGVELGTIQGDALEERDYSRYSLNKPAFFMSVVWPEEEKALNCLKSSLKKYCPKLLEESLFVTYGVREHYPLEEKCRLTLPTYWDRKTDYHMSRLKV